MMQDKVLNLVVDKKEQFIKAINEYQQLGYKVASVYTNTAKDKMILCKKSFISFGNHSTLFKKDQASAPGYTEWQ